MALLLDETMAKGLIEARLDILQVSCWASTPEEYAANTPGTDTKNFDQLVKNLTYLAHLKARRHRHPLPSLRSGHGPSSGTEPTGNLERAGLPRFSLTHLHHRRFGSPAGIL